MNIHGACNRYRYRYRSFNSLTCTSLTPPFRSSSHSLTIIIIFINNIIIRWSTEAVSESVVQAVLQAWEMERHHAAERHLYPELLSVFQEIKAQHPDVIIGAVTDGRANPLFMTFTLAPYFDFCMSWEDDQGNRQKFFQELGSVEGNVELKWIYDAALEKYYELSDALNVMKKKKTVKKDAVVAAGGAGSLSTDDGAADADNVSGSSSANGEQAAVASNNNNKEEEVEESKPIWIHVGDDLAYDVGGAALSGAKTIYVELADQYGQTARHRFDDIPNQPAWSTTMQSELYARKKMNEAAADFVDCRVNFLTRLPEAINEILQDE
jgi:phosphoglycolate phosphatase-like HAD superfamily hydrolase